MNFILRFLNFCREFYKRKDYINGYLFYQEDQRLDFSIRIEEGAGSNQSKITKIIKVCKAFFNMLKTLENLSYKKIFKKKIDLIFSLKTKASA